MPLPPGAAHQRQQPFSISMRFCRRAAPPTYIFEIFFTRPSASVKQPVEKGDRTFNGLAALLTLRRLAKHEPIAVVTASVVCFFPAWIGDRPLANLDNAIASREPRGNSRLNQNHMGPLEPV